MAQANLVTGAVPVMDTSLVVYSGTCSAKVCKQEWLFPGSISSFLAACEVTALCPVLSCPLVTFSSVNLLFWGPFFS